MRRSLICCLLSSAFLVAGACRDSGRVDAATLERTADGLRLHVTILAASSDSRIVPAREAIARWNDELRRLGRNIQLDSAIVRAPSVPDGVLRAAAGEVAFGRGPATRHLRASLSKTPGDLIIALSGTDLISYGLPWGAGEPGLVVIRRADIPPLSLPNTVRNVVAHELGHALGLEHNGSAASLMCGRPAACRPAAFASDSAYFFPLTIADENRLRERWP